MAATPYKPTNWGSESISQPKLQQMANNDQWLFENMARVRYSAGGLTRDSGLKIAAGKTAYPATQSDWIDVFVYFGTFFSAGCKPVVNASVEPALGRIGVVLSGLNFGTEMDYRGFRAHVYQDFQASGNPLQGAGWVHWQAVGY